MRRVAEWNAALLETRSLEIQSRRRVLEIISSGAISAWTAPRML